MKLTTFILIIALAQVSAKGFGQKITLNTNNTPIEKVLQSIREQSGYGIVYNARDLGNQKITLKLNNASIEDALNALVKGLPLNYKIVNTNILITREEPSFLDRLAERWADTDVRGVVRNEKGESMEGITVSVKGSNNRTSTNAQGEFLLKGVNEDATLVFSGIAIETYEVKVKGKESMTVNVRTKQVQLENVDVVSTGYQDIPKERATGSFGIVDNKTLNLQTGTNILKRLEGVTSGILFDNNKERAGKGLSNDNISIRGLSTINASMEPLIVLDGFIYEASISNINPNNVESITILKDAAAASIWGARAGNGVIVITTKKGKLNQKPSISMNANVIIKEKPDLHYIPQMSSGDYIDIEQLLFNQGFFDNAINVKWQAITPAVEIFLKRRNGEISASDSAQKINALKAIDTRDQYLKYFYKPAATQQYSLNINGGNSINAYTISAAYDHTNGNLRNKEQRLNLSIDELFKPIDKLSIRIGASFTQQNSLSGAPEYPSNGIEYGGTRKVNYVSLVDENGNPAEISSFLRKTYTDTVGAGRLLDWKYYPLEDWKHTTQNIKTSELLGHGELQYKLFNFLEVGLRYQYGRQQIKNDYLGTLESYEARNAINSFSQIDRNTGAVTYFLPKGGIRKVYNEVLSSYTLRPQINIDHNFNDHSISALIGIEKRQVKKEGDRFTSYGYQSDPLINNAVDYVNLYPTFIDGTYGNISGAPEFFLTNQRYFSAYANASYSYRQKYTISGSVRKDGSNLLGLKTNDKFDPFWSIGAAWKISDESIYKVAFLPSLKLRVTYGSSGNLDLSKTALPIGVYGIDRLTNLPSAVVRTLNNPALKWEKVSMFNAGLDFATKGGVLSGSIDFYNKKSTDLYGPSFYDYTTWGLKNEIVVNSANMTGRGVDFRLTSKNIDDMNVKWTTDFIFNYGSEKVTKYQAVNPTQVSGLIFLGGMYVTPVVGKPLYSIAAYRWGGLDAAGKPQGFVDGKLSTDYQKIIDGSLGAGESEYIKYIGPSSPNKFGTLINTVSWKNLSATIMFSYKFGYFFRKSTISYSSLINSGIGHKDFAKRWQQPGDETKTNIPVFVYPLDQGYEQSGEPFYEYSEINVLRGDHIRFQTLNLVYSIPRRGPFSKLFRELQIYANAANLGVVWSANKENIDPEYPIGPPPSRTWAIGIRAGL